MKKSVNSNIYGYALDSTWDRFGDVLSGAHEALACIVSALPLSDRARDAFEKSFTKLGYGENACTYVVLARPDLDLFALIEGLDPLAIVAADASAAEALGQAYREPLAADRHMWLFGRTAVVFASFEAMLASPEEKQRAWALLKRLAR